VPDVEESYDDDNETRKVSDRLAKIKDHSLEHHSFDSVDDLDYLENIELDDIIS
jgi:hypothetical protein